MKSDGEHSIMDVTTAVAKFHGGRVVLEKSPTGESQSNGVVEEVGKTVRGFARIMKYQMEEKAQAKLTEISDVSEWMIRWAAMVPSRYLIGHDGRTAYERRRGRKCRIGVVPFGETVMCKELREGKTQKDKMDTEWKDGIWLGHARESNEVLIGTDDGVVRAYAVIRKPPGERWSAERLKTMRGTPQQPDPRKPGTHVPIQVCFDPPSIGTVDESTPLRREKGVRRMKITKRMFEDHGYSEGCEGCRYQRAGMAEQRVHSEECRAKLVEQMGETEAGRQKIEKQNERMNNWLAEEMAEGNTGMPENEGAEKQEEQGEEQEDAMMQQQIGDTAAEEEREESPMISSIRRMSRGCSS